MAPLSLLLTSFHSISVENQKSPVERPIVTIERKIGLPWLLGIVGAIAFSGVSMHFSVQSLATTVTQLQASFVQLQGAITAGNISDAVLAADVSLLKYRISQIEIAQEKINAALMPAKAGGK